MEKSIALKARQRKETGTRHFVVVGGYSCLQLEELLNVGDDRLKLLSQVLHTGSVSDCGWIADKQVLTKIHAHTHTPSLCLLSVLLS
jgi:hypothetical protein